MYVQMLVQRLLLELCKLVISVVWLGYLRVNWFPNQAFFSKIKNKTSQKLKECFPGNSGHLAQVQKCRKTWFGVQARGKPTGIVEPFNLR